MGIPSYFSYIIKNYSKIIYNLQYHRNVEKTVFDSLYMDCNSIVYDAYYALEKDGLMTGSTNADNQLILDRVVQKIHEYIMLIGPSKTIYIAFDGVAPFAKMEQQRTRRYKSWYMSTIEQIGNDQTLANKPLDKPSVKWNTSSITPGTHFMNLLSTRMAYEFNHNELKYKVKKIIVSGSTEPGEGEHKMFQHIRDFAEEDENVSVYGLDSDLIMLSIFHSYLCKNIYIFREAPEFLKSNVQVDQKNGPNDPLFMDIKRLESSISDEMNCKFADEQRIYDYVFLCFFLGNDFLPHFPALNIRTSGIQTLLDTYRLHIGSHVDRFFIAKDTGTIQWRWVELFVRELAKNEHQLLLNEYSVRDKWDNRTWPEKTKEDREQVLQNAPIILRAEEKYICPQESFWEDRYYKVIFKEERTPATVKTICTNYLEGLEWVFKYYTIGCPHWRWKYNYNYPPLLSDLCKFVPHFKTDFISSSLGLDRPFKPCVQLAYVIPPANHAELLPKKNAELLRTKYRYLYPERCDFQWAFCRYFWEAHVLLPEIGLNVLYNHWTEQLEEI